MSDYRDEGQDICQDIGKDVGKDVGKGNQSNVNFKKKK